MTLKQLQAELKRAKGNLEAAKRNDKEMQELRGFSTYDKEIAYYTKRVDTLTAQLPAAEKAEEEKTLKKIAANQLKDKTNTIEYIVRGSSVYGITPEGKRWIAELNYYGETDRRFHCYTLYIGGELQFTSGTLDTVLQTVASK